MSNSLLLGGAVVRKIKQSGEGYELREPVNPYIVNFEAEDGDTGLENRYFWND